MNPIITKDEMVECSKQHMRNLTRLPRLTPTEVRKLSLSQQIQWTDSITKKYSANFAWRAQQINKNSNLECHNYHEQLLDCFILGNCSLDCTV